MKGTLQEVRELLAANAPPVPEWFCPVMPPKPPSSSPFRVRLEWEDLQIRQKLFQWPWYYADGVLSRQHQPNPLKQYSGGAAPSVSTVPSVANTPGSSDIPPVESSNAETDGERDQTKPAVGDVAPPPPADERSEPPPCRRIPPVTRVMPCKLDTYG